MNIGGTIIRVMEKVSSPVSGSSFEGGRISVAALTQLAVCMHVCVCGGGGVLRGTEAFWSPISLKSKQCHCHVATGRAFLYMWLPLNVGPS